MKISNPADKPAPAVHGSSPATTANASAPAAGTTAIPATADASAKIELSNTAATLLTSHSTPEFDAAKVARISKSIQDGSFKINAGAIADKLISNAKEVLGQVPS